MFSARIDPGWLAFKARYRLHAESWVRQFCHPISCYEKEPASKLVQTLLQLLLPAQFAKLIQMNTRFFKYDQSGSGKRPISTSPIHSPWFVSPSWICGPVTICQTNPLMHFLVILVPGIHNEEGTWKKRFPKLTGVIQALCFWRQ